MVYPTLTDNFNLATLNANFLELYNQTNTSSNVAIPPNKILAMPTKPTYSGLVVTVYAGTKVSIPNGRNADGTVKNEIYTLGGNITITVSTNNKQLIVLRPDASAYVAIYDRIYFVNYIDRPTTLQTTSTYYMYCADTNYWYYTTGSTTANWQIDGRRCPICEVITTTTIASLTVYDVYNTGQEIDKINVKQSYTPTATNLGTITEHLAMVKSGIGRYKLDTTSGNWTANTSYTICTLSIQYRPTIKIAKDIITGGGQIALFGISESGIVSIMPRSIMNGATFRLDETYII